MSTLWLLDSGVCGSASDAEALARRLDTEFGITGPVQLFERSAMDLATLLTQKGVGTFEERAAIISLLAGRLDATKRPKNISWTRQIPSAPEGVNLAGIARVLYDGAKQAAPSKNRNTIYYEILSLMKAKKLLGPHVSVTKVAAHLNKAKETQYCRNECIEFAKKLVSN